MKKLIALLLALVMVFGLVACNSATETTPEEPKTEAPATEEPKTEEPAAQEPAEQPAAQEPAAVEDTIPNTFHYQPVVNDTGREIRIAVLTTITNPFWVDVCKGTEDVLAYMAQPQYNCTVDMQTFETFDGQAVSEAIDTCITMEYDAICTVGVADSIVSSIAKAVDAGIPVYLFNSNTGVENKATAFVGQDLYAAGEKLGSILADLMGNQGKAAIITGLYSVNAHELRRTGAEKALTEGGVEVVGSVECNDSADTAYSQAKDFMNANPDLTGILVTAAGQAAVARAVDEAGKADTINVVAFDTTEEMIPYIRDGVIKCTLGQDPYAQGSDPVILAYNEVVKGVADVQGDAFTELIEYRPDNINDYFPE